MDDPNRQFMRIAIEEAKKSAEDGARVGAVLVRDGVLLMAGHKGELGDKMHAEQVVLKKAEEAGIDLRGATAFVTLEPCSNLTTKRTCCADLLAAAGVAEVYIGRYDINPQINRLGWRALVDNGVRCRDFPADLRKELEALTSRFEGYFLRRDGLTGIAKFDFTQNGGQYVFATDETENARVWVTRWNNCGAQAIYANGGLPGFVALARYAREFDEIDDPDALDYGSHSACVAIGEIASFRNEHGHVLCKVLQIEPTPDYGGGPHVSVKVSYQIRLRADS
ncbi:deaminase [Micromonospora sp. DT229]|uniref:deaminase n=1 Tax=Micromonospora sp. DT229 TaxID=3393430 RepID=UPI003CE840C1